MAQELARIPPGKSAYITRQAFVRLLEQLTAHLSDAELYDKVRRVARAAGAHAHDALAPPQLKHGLDQVALSPACYRLLAELFESMPHLEDDSLDPEHAKAFASKVLTQRARAPDCVCVCVRVYATCVPLLMRCP